jgi:hypothetical protein
MGKGRIAGSQDAVVAKVNVHLFLERALDVNFGQDPEPVFLELRGYMLDGFLEGHLQDFAKVV